VGNGASGYEANDLVTSASETSCSVGSAVGWLDSGLRIRHHLAVSLSIHKLSSVSKFPWS
jgi:hypothetical protein